MEQPKDSAPPLDEAMFPKLNEEQTAQLAALGVRRSFPAGEIVFDQGAVGRSLYVVLEGGLEVVIPSAGGDTHLRLHQPGDFTGELDMLSGRPSLVKAQTVAPTKLIEIDPAKLRNIVQTDPGLGEFLL